jgi:hypothetical protein
MCYHVFMQSNPQREELNTMNAERNLCLACNRKKTVGAHVLCGLCKAQETRDELARIDAQSAADFSNLVYGFKLQFGGSREAVRIHQVTL